MRARHLPIAFEDKLHDFAAARHRSRLGDGQDFLEAAPEAAALQMTVGLEGEIDDAHGSEIADAAAAILADNMKEASVVMVIQRDASGAVPDGVEGVLNEFFDKMARRTRLVEGGEALRGDLQPSASIRHHEPPRSPPTGGQKLTAAVRKTEAANE